MRLNQVWKTHCWRMETKIHQTLCDVINGDTCVLSDLTNINDAFVSDKAIFSFVKHRKERIEFLRQIISRQDRNFGRFT